MSVRALSDRLRMAAGLAFFVLVAVAWSLVCAVLGRLLPARLARRVGRRGLHAVFRLILNGMRALGIVEYDGSAFSPPRRDGPMLIAPNHPSLLDILFIGAELDSMVCVMKSSAADNLLFGPPARLAGLLDNAPARAMIRGCVHELQQGSAVVLFPEGTRTLSAPVNDFGRALARISQHAGVPVQTVFVETDSPYLSKGWPIWKRPAFPVRYRVRTGRVFDVPVDAAGWTDELQRYFEHELAGACVAPAACAEP